MKYNTHTPKRLFFNIYFLILCNYELRIVDTQYTHMHAHTQL